MRKKRQLSESIGQSGEFRALFDEETQEPTEITFYDPAKVRVVMQDGRCYVVAELKTKRTMTIRIEPGRPKTPPMEIGIQGLTPGADDTKETPRLLGPLEHPDGKGGTCVGPVAYGDCPNCGFQNGSDERG